MGSKKSPPTFLTILYIPDLLFPLRACGRGRTLGLTLANPVWKTTCKGNRGQTDLSVRYTGGSYQFSSQVTSANSGGGGPRAMVFQKKKSFKSVNKRSLGGFFF